MSILLKYVALDAIHDASARFDAPRCSAGTREAVQEDIMTWTRLPILALAPEKLRLLLWMSGAAGTGKSAILQTIAEKADKQKLLAASFFFSYKYPARDGMLIPTLAYQIAVRVPAIQEHMAVAISKDPSIFSKSTEKQLDVLIIEPIARALDENPSAAAWPTLIAIDGLDECKSNPAGHIHKPISGDDETRSTDKQNHWESPSSTDDGEKQQLVIIKLLHESLVTRRLPFRVALASRPDMPMRGFFSSAPVSSCTRQIVLNEVYKPGDDIRLFLQSSFERIRAQHEVEIGWPGREVIETLALSNASGQFVYADTVVKFVDGPSCDPTGNLDVIMGIAQNTAASQKPSTDSSVANPYAPLDAMYAAILNRSPEPKESVMAIHLILRVFIHSSGDRALSANDFNAFLQYRSTDVARVFGKLHSLVYAPPVDDAEKSYSLHRKSLQDFLYSRPRCGPDLHLSHQALLEGVSIQLLRSSGRFHIRIDQAEEPCTHNCPYVLHIDGCFEFEASLRVREEFSSLISTFSVCHTHDRILQHGYQPVWL